MVILEANGRIHVIRGFRISCFSEGIAIREGCYEMRILCRCGTDPPVPELSAICFGEKQLERMARDGFFEKAEQNLSEVYDRWKQCDTVWILAAPDFPMRGYLVQKSAQTSRAAHLAEGDVKRNPKLKSAALRAVSAGGYPPRGSAAARTHPADARRSQANTFPRSCPAGGSC